MHTITHDRRQAPTGVRLMTAHTQLPPARLPQAAQAFPLAEPQNMLAHALAYARAGVAVFPANSRTKRPRVEGGFYAATTDEARIEEWWGRWPDAAIAAATGRASGFFVVDLDVKDGVDGAANFVELEAEHGEPIRRDVMQKTGGGGLQVFLAMPPDDLGFRVKSTASELASGVDIRGDGGYVLLPPSGHPSGGRYTWLGEPLTKREGDLPEAPAWLLELVRRQPRDKKDQTPLYDWDHETDILLAVHYLENEAPEAVEGQGGNLTTYRVAAELKDRGISEDMALELMDKSYNPRCAPQWDLDELRVVISHAYEYATEHQPGTKSVQCFDVLTAEESAKIDDQFGPPAAQSLYVSFPTPWSELSEDDPPPRRYIFKGPGALPRGVVGFLAGQGGCGKSTLALSLAMSVAASGRDFTDGLFHVAAKGPVLCVFAEDDEPEVHRRANRIQRRAGVSLSREEKRNLHLLCAGEADPRIIARTRSGGLEPRPGLTHLKRLVRELRPILVILDSLSVLCPGAEVDNEGAAQVMTLLRQLVSAGDEATILALTHVSKSSLSEKSPGGKKPSVANLERSLEASALRGASALVDNARWASVMTAVPRGLNNALAASFDANLAALAVPKTNYGPRLGATYMRNEVGVLLRHDPAKVQQETLESAVTQAIRDAGGVLPTSAIKRDKDGVGAEIADLLGVSRRVLWDEAGKLVEAGILKEVVMDQRTGRRGFQLADESPAAEAL